MILNTPHSDLHSDPCFAESDNRDLNEFVQEYPRVEYAGVELRTEASQQFIRTDNAKVRVVNLMQPTPGTQLLRVPNTCFAAICT